MKILNLKNKVVFFVGIKGTGMAALAELFKNRGAVVLGSDCSEKFYTDEVLQQLNIPYVEKFSSSNINSDIDLIVYSSAYSEENSPELVKAAELGIKKLVYSEALGLLSTYSTSAGVCGVHGKTTTTAICGSLIKSLNLNASVLVGSAVKDFNNRSTLSNGDKYFIAETCEYQRHFLSFSPSYIILTSVEPDHLDYFKDLEDIKNAFVEYALKLPNGGTLIYCADDNGASDVALRVKKLREDIKLVDYGKSATSNFKIENIEHKSSANIFKLKFSKSSFSIRVPGDHLILNATAAIALIYTICIEENISIDDSLIKKMQEGIYNFLGCKRRSEIIGEVNNILIMDDYAHHPTAIKLTLEGYKEFFKNRRIIVDFMSHTYSRTEALLEEFSKSFESADLVILNKIYASAREKGGHINGETLFNEVKKHHNNVLYFEEPLDGLQFLIDNLKPTDVFITMGAGNNNILGKTLFDKLVGESK